MEVVTNLGQFRHSCRKFLCHHVGFNGTETDAFNAFHFMYLTDDVCEGDGFQILAVTCHMDACQHHFFEAVFCQTFHFCDHVLRLTAADGTAGIRNDTVGTELAASILNLQVRSGAVCQFLDFQWFKNTFVHNICHIILHALFRLIIFHQFHDFTLVLGANDQIHTMHRRQFFRRSLGITAHNGNNGVFILAFHLTDELTGFLIPEICHRTGIDDIYICLIVYGNHFIALFRKQFGDGFAFILIDFTP